MADENSSSVQAIPGTSFGTMPNVMSIDDFETEYMAEVMARVQARKNARQQVQQPTPIPLPINTPRTSEFVPKFNSLCQTKGIDAKFEFFGPAGGSPPFGAKVVFADKIVEDAGPYPSKRDAKERVAEKALPVLEALPSARATVESEENYIGQLLEYTQGHGIKAPEWEAFKLGEQSFAYEAKLDIAGYGTQIFGSRNKAFSNKKLAKMNAAMEGVAWLKRHDRWDVGKSRKRKAGQLEAVTGEGQGGEAGSGAVEQASNRPSHELMLPLLRLLSLPPPDYNLQPSGTSSTDQHTGFWDCSASFSSEPRMPTNLGAVRNVYGKKNAKEECAVGVLEFLQELVDAREKKYKAFLDSKLVQQGEPSGSSSAPGGVNVAR